MHNYTTTTIISLVCVSGVVQDIQEDFCWHLVHSDVFCQPKCSMLLAVFVGSGAQLLVMATICLGQTV